MLLNSCLTIRYHSFLDQAVSCNPLVEPKARQTSGLRAISVRYADKAYCEWREHGKNICLKSSGATGSFANWAASRYYGRCMCSLLESKAIGQHASSHGQLNPQKVPLLGIATKPNRSDSANEPEGTRRAAHSTSSYRFTCSALPDRMLAALTKIDL